MLAQDLGNRGLEGSAEHGKRGRWGGTWEAVDPMVVALHGLLPPQAAHLCTPHLFISPY